MRAPEVLAASLLPLLVAGGAGAADPTPQQQLQSVQQDMAAARARADEAKAAGQSLAAELADLQARSVTAAAAAQAGEQELTANEARLKALAEEERVGREELGRDGSREGALLTALVHVAAVPRPALLLLGPEPPLDRMRSALVMARTVPALEADAARLKRVLASLNGAEAEEGKAQARGAVARQALDAEKARIAGLIAAKAALQADAQRTESDSQQRLLALASAAGNLKDLIDRIQPPRGKGGGADTAMAVPRPDAGKPFAAAKGALVVPVAGKLVARFGAPDANGTPLHGITIETRPGAQVVAPYDGEIAFAGPFRGYGQILIIAHGDGYHSLLAGLDRVDGSPGERLIAGEPVGSMSEHADKPQLYLELRHDNQPIDPAPWLTTRLEKVNE